MLRRATRFIPDGDSFISSDVIYFVFFLTCIISMFAFELCVVLPGTEEGFIPTSFHIAAGTYICMNVLGNLAMTMLTDTSTRKIISPAVLKQGWHFCSFCEANSPVRSFHCNRCNTCILKRDHHCPFSMCCIGLKNFRYYLIFLLYLCIGALYSFVFNMYFIWDVLGGVSLFSVATHVIPFIFHMFGYISFTIFIYTLLSMLSIVGFCMASTLLLIHVKQMLHNQTSFEKNQGITLYDLGWKRNIVECLGEEWYLIWIFPLMKSELPSDGIIYSLIEIPNYQPHASSHSQTNLKYRKL